MRIVALAGVLVFLDYRAQAEIIARWTFNGTDAPVIGSGSAGVIGGAVASYAAGSPSDTTTNNTAWNTASYPAQGTSNKTAGVEFRVSTEAYSEVRIDWEQRLSATASKFLRFQYAIDGTNFVDVPGGVVVASRTMAFEARMQSMAEVAGASDNPALAFRLVTEFESSAAGAGTPGYVATYETNVYSRNGTIRFDMVTVSGTRMDGANSPPAITRVADQILRVEQTSLPLAFSVSDREDPAEALAVTALASDPAVISEVLVTGTAERRELTLKAGIVPGRARVSLTVTDSGGRGGTTDFGVTVLPVNTAPMIGPIAGTNLVRGGATEAIGFEVGDLESAAEELTVRAFSANPALVPNDELHVTLGGAGSNRTVRITPTAGQVGVAPITVAASDGLLETSSTFAVAVRPLEAVLLYDPFSYANGSLCPNSGHFWRNRSGVDGECQIREERLELAGSRTEDVTAALAAGPYPVGEGTVLYASIRFNFLGAPKTDPEYFAHFVGGSALRGRVYAGATDVWPGAFRLYVANGSETNRALPWNLSTNTTYTAVVRYEVDSAVTTMWVDPRAESDSGTSAADGVSAVAISGYGFRQDSGLGTTLTVDDVKVGLSFAAVTEPWDSPPLLLEVKRGVAGEVVLQWVDPAWVLQAGESLAGAFIDVYGARSPYTNAADGPARFFRLRGQPRSSSSAGE